MPIPASSASFRDGPPCSLSSPTLATGTCELLPFSSITDQDLARTGEPDLETLRRRAAHAGPIHDDTLLYRVEFHVVRPRGDTPT